MLNKKVSIYHLLAVLILNNLIVFLYLGLRDKVNQNSGSAQSPDNSTALIHENDPNCNYKISRLNGFKHIRPLIFAEPENEAVDLVPIKEALQTKINSLKSSGIINSASVYIRLFHKGKWINIDNGEKLSPGSLLKVPELITFMKMNETDPSLLNKTVIYNEPIFSNKTTTFTSKSIELGKTYTIKELLYYMIAYSDNNATALLNRLMDLNVFKKVFTDLDLPAPDLKASDYKMNAMDYSQFMKVLYNGSYLSNKDSEFCVELLNQSDFNLGIKTGIPSSCVVADKFGEGGDARTQKYDLSESAFINCNKHTYLLTIMTDGPDMKSLPPVLSSISEQVHNQMEEYLQTIN